MTIILSITIYKLKPLISGPYIKCLAAFHPVAVVTVLNLNQKQEDSLVHKSMAEIIPIKCTIHC